MTRKQTRMRWRWYTIKGPYSSFFFVYVDAWEDLLNERGRLNICFFVERALTVVAGMTQTN